jgi:transposase
MVVGEQCGVFQKMGAGTMASSIAVIRSFREILGAGTFRHRRPKRARERNRKIVLTRCQQRYTMLV